MSSLATSKTFGYQGAHRLSSTGIAGIIAAHVGLLTLLASLDVMPLREPLNALMVHMIAAPLPAPQITPPRPQPVERKPVVRPQPTPAPRQPLLAATSEAPISAAEARPVPETPAPPPAAVAAAETPVSQPRFDTDYLLNPPPAYPALARRMGEEGKVVLRVFVEPSGRPSQIEIKTSSTSPRLDQAVLDAVWRWKFVAARRADEAVGAWVLVPIVFNLKN